MEDGKTQALGNGEFISLHSLAVVHNAGGSCLTHWEENQPNGQDKRMERPPRKGQDTRSP